MKRSINRNPYQSPSSVYVISCSIVLVDKAVKQRVIPSTRRLPEVRPISTFLMKKLEYLENAQRIFLRPENFFSRETFQSEDDDNTQNCSLSLTFKIHCSSTYAQAFYHFFFVVVLQKGEQRPLEKRETQHR